MIRISNPEFAASLSITEQKLRTEIKSVEFACLFEQRYSSLVCRVVEMRK